MGPMTIEQLPLFLLLMLPGLISRKVYDLQVPSTRDDAARYALDGLCFGTLNAALWYVPATWALRHATIPGILFGLVLVVFVVSPVVLGILTVRALKSSRLRGLAQHPTPMAWDYFFGRGKSCFMLCRLKNGKSIAGYFGPNSFASSFPNPRDIYLEQTWLMDSDGRLTVPIPGSAGVLVSFDECELVEFLEAIPQSAPEVQQ